MRADPRTRRTLACLPVLVVLLAALPAPASGQGETRETGPLVRVTGSPVVTFPMSRTDATIPVRVRVASAMGDKRTLRPIVLRRSGGERYTDDLEKFSAVLRPKKGPVRIDITVANEPPLRPGTYRLVLGARRGERQSLIRLEVRVQGAVMTLAEPVEMDADAPFLGLLGGEPTGDLVLANESEHTALTPTIAVVRGPRRGTVTVAAQPEKIEAGQAGALKVAASGVPIGVTSGTLRVSADELSAPQSIPYRLDVRRSDLWIPIVVTAGFLLGLLLRGVLAWLLRRLHATQQVQATIAKLQRDIEKARDLQHEQKLVEALDALDGVNGWLTRRTGTIEAVRAAERARTAAFEDLASRERLAADRRAQLAKRIESRAGVDVVDDELDRAADELNEAAYLLLTHDAAAASDLVGKATDRVQDKVPDRVTAWMQDLLGIADVTDQVPMRQGQREKIAPFAASVNSAVVAESPVAADDDEELYARCRTASVAAQRLVGAVATETRATVHAVIARLGDMAANGTNPVTDVAALRKRLARFDATWQAVRADDLKGPAAMTEAAHELQEELRRIAVERAGDDESARTAAAAAVEEGDPLTALGAGAAAAAAQEGEQWAGDGDDAETTGPAAPATVAGTEPVMPSRGRRTFGRVDRDAIAVPAGPGALATGGTLLGLAAVHLLRTLIVAAIFAGVGWLAFQDDFVGTTKDLLGIFFWAFATDLTVAGVTTLATQRAATPAGAATTEPEATVAR